MNSRSRRPRRAAPRMELAPLIDCAFTLIIFFAVSTTLITTRAGMKVNLPKAATVEKMPAHVQITIDDAQKIFFEDLEVSQDSLGQMVKSRIEDEPDMSFIIGAAKSVPYERLMAVLDAVRGAGGTKLALQADQKRIENPDERQ